jgi:acetylornithine deacetylase/succinyl-diaminopimelate desuccinylase-like protein
LVDIRSVTGEERALRDAIAERLSATVEVDIVRESLVAGRRTGRPRIDLYGHLDTVPENGNLPARVEDGRVQGLGTSDMKSGLALMLAALESEVVTDGPYDVFGIFYGDNAVTKAGQWLAGMHLREARDVIVEGLTFRETFAVTTASGGVARNVIPALFTLNVNHRYPPDRSPEEAEQILADVCAAADRFEVVDRAPAGPIPSDNRHVDRLRASGVAAVTAKTAWTDVARLTQRGIPAANFGPGEVALAHRADESVSIEALQTGWAILERFLTAR